MTRTVRLAGLVVALAVVLSGVSVDADAGESATSAGDALDARVQNLEAIDGTLSSTSNHRSATSTRLTGGPRPPD